MATKAEVRAAATVSDPRWAHVVARVDELEQVIAPAVHVKAPGFVVEVVELSRPRQLQALQVQVAGRHPHGRLTAVVLGHVRDA